MNSHPATEAPQMYVNPDGTTRPETEQERIDRIQTRERIAQSMKRIQDRHDFRPGDKVLHMVSAAFEREATVLGRDRQHLYVRFADNGRQNRVPIEHVLLVEKGDGHGEETPLIHYVPLTEENTIPDAEVDRILDEQGIPSREEAAAEFAETIISNPPREGGLIFKGIPEGRAAQRTQLAPDFPIRPAATVEDPRLCEEPALPAPGIPVGIQLLHSDARIPTQARAGDAGYDLHSIEEVTVYRGGRRLIGTGIAVAIPEGYVGLIMPRSGLANKAGIDILGGVIDAGYRGEVKVILQSHDSAAGFSVKVGDRIAQLVIQPVAAVDFQPMDTLPDSERAAGGFGSTGA